MSKKVYRWLSYIFSLLALVLIGCSYYGWHYTVTAPLGAIMMLLALGYFGFKGFGEVEEP